MDRMLRGVLPSLFSIYPDDGLERRIHRTSYLDGLRGITSLIVFGCHYTEENHKYLLPSYGPNHDGRPSSWIQFPSPQDRLLRTAHDSLILCDCWLSALIHSCKRFKRTNRIDASRYSRQSALGRGTRLFILCIVATFWDHANGVSRSVMRAGLAAPRTAYLL